MRPSCPCASDNLHVPVEQPRLLLYKEAPEFLLQLLGDEQTDSPEHSCLGFGETTRNLRAGGEVSW
jgi:hypothetical protein